MKEAFKDYLEWMSLKKYSLQTIRQCDYTLRKLHSFLDSENIMRLQDVTHEDLEKYQRYLMDLGLSTGSRENLIMVVRRFFTRLERTGKIFMDPGVDIVPPKRLRGLRPVPTEEELEQLLAVPDVSGPVGLRDRAILEVAYGCGLRRSELAGLSILDPDIKNGSLRVSGKGNKERIVPLGRQAVKWLKMYLNQARPKLLKGDPEDKGLWISIRGRKMDGAAIRQQLKRYADKSGIETPTDLHSLRRACATHMLRNGAHPVDIGMLLGHSNLKTLSQYLSVTISDLRKMHKNTKLGG
ncbi:MAG: tyrosine-type recombinase/integrase [bacterium]|nr:tyrosine-type recombinase/integrase [bacterium]